MDIKEWGSNISQGIDVANDVLNKTKDIKDEIINQYQDYENGRNYGRSEQYQKDKAKEERLRNKMSRRALLFALLWIAMIVATIVLCVTGNDYVLKLLNL